MNGDVFDWKFIYEATVSIRIIEEKSADSD